MELGTAKYLLRFDDLCPTMSRQRFERFISIMDRYRIHPILAVVPDNRDPELNIENPDPHFWLRMRDLEWAGATIALHGYRHVCRSRGSSFLGLHSQTEFAGVPQKTQTEWIRLGLDILRHNGLSPKLFVAPRHGFDSATLRALVQERLPFLSDGFAARPFTRGEVVWIPQQLWEPVQKRQGLWTICLHTNTAKLDLEDQLEHFLHRFADQFTTFDKVVSKAKPAQLRWNERMREAFVLHRLRLRSA
jgi:predicted deacetylase